MKRALLFVLAAIVSGCGGGSAATQGQVAGVVFDVDGVPVHGATVSTFIPALSPQTVSNSAGTYLLDQVPSGSTVIYAEIFQGGHNYSGQSTAQVFANDRTQSLNIMVVRDDQQCSVKGTVRASGNLRVGGAKVFAKAGAQFSSVAITDNNGHYELDRLPAGQNITVLASGLGFDSSSTTVNLNNGVQSTTDFTLNQAAGGSVSPPTNVNAISFTSPFEDTRARGGMANAGAFEQMKRILSAAHKKHASKSRATLTGDPVEIDLSWDPVSGDNVLGYGIYRAFGNNLLDPVDLLSDPLAEIYEDQTDGIHPNNDYRYGVVTVESQDGTGSTMSNVVTVTPLDSLTGGDVSVDGNHNPTFHWTAVSGVDTYQVFLFDQFPGIMVDPFFTSATTASTSLIYNGSALVPGDTYYMVVVGTGHNGAAFTISPILAFNP